MGAARVQVVVTNGDLGSDSTWFAEFAIYTWQGKRAARRWAQELANKTGKPAWVVRRGYWRDNYDREIPQAAIVRAYPIKAL